MSLKGTQLRHLRALAHHLDPIVHVGKGGVSESVVAAADQALSDHELVKVRLPQVEKAERKALASDLGTRTRAEVAGLTGRVAILYRRHPEEPRIQLPA